MKKQTIVFNGGLGNQLFQYTYMLYLWKKGICQPRYSTSLYEKHKIHAGFEADKVFDFSAFQHDNRDYNMLYSLGAKCKKYFNAHLFFSEESKEGRIGFRPLIGYWQDIKYYQAVETEIEMNFLGLDQYCRSEAFLNAVQETESVFIHVRRGDYCGNSLYKDLTSTAYYRKAVEWVQENVSNPVFYVFSDDIAWCKTYFEAEPYMRFVTYEGQTTLGDLAIMLKCRHAIIANSSFSWWGTALHSKAHVVYPRIYYENGDIQPLYKVNWIGID